MIVFFWGIQFVFPKKSIYRGGGGGGWSVFKILNYQYFLFQIRQDFVGGGGGGDEHKIVNSF